MICPQCGSKGPFAVQTLTWIDIEANGNKHFDDDDAPYCEPYGPGAEVICRNPGCEWQGRYREIEGDDQ